ncbi:MAG: hypothetical protein U1E76_07600 [Planctomycetota bacterium]
MLALASGGGLMTTLRVSVSSNEDEGDRRSLDPAISGDGRFVAFRSDATDLVFGDTNDLTDIFVRDLELGITTRVSTSSSGAQADGECFMASISADGRVVAFSSQASNLVANDNNHVEDVFVVERLTHRLLRISTDSAGVEGDGRSYEPRLSLDREQVVFTSTATNLVADDQNDRADVFVKDLKTDRTMRVSVGTNGEQGNGASTSGSVSRDGRFVAFASVASNLVADDHNGCCDVFLHDCVTGETRRLSVDGNGNEGNHASTQPVITPDGSCVAFQSFAQNLVGSDTNDTYDIFVKDVSSGTVTRVSIDSQGNESNGKSGLPAISDDGRYVVFASDATNLVAFDTNESRDIYVHDRLAHMTTRVSVAALGEQANDGSNEPAISGSGAAVAFLSVATNLVKHDGNGYTDVFVRTAITPGTTTPAGSSQQPLDGLTGGMVGTSWRGRLARIVAVPIRFWMRQAHGPAGHRESP